MRPFGDDISSSERIIAKAVAKYGGQTTRWMLINTIKKVAQQYQVGDLITLVDTASKGLLVRIDKAVSTRLNLNHATDKFYYDLMNSVEDCGYKVAVGDSYLEIHKA